MYKLMLSFTKRDICFQLQHRGGRRASVLVTAVGLKEERVDLSANNNQLLIELAV